MKTRKEIIIIDGMVWTYLESEKKYVNEDGIVVVRPRANSKGKSKGKSVGKSVGKNQKKKSQVSKDILNVDNYLTIQEIEEFYLYPYKKELFIFFIEHIIKAYKRLKWLERRGKLKKDFFLNRDLKNDLRGVYISQKNMIKLLGINDFKLTINNLVDKGYLKINEIVCTTYKNNNIDIKGDLFDMEMNINNTLSFLVPTEKLLCRTPSILTISKDYSLKKIIEVKEDIQNKKLDEHNIIPIILKNLSVIQSNNEYFNKAKTDIYRISIDNFGRRYHSPLTNLEKTERSKLKIDNEYLKEADISNSQMTFLSLVFNSNLEGIRKFKRLCLDGIFYEDAVASNCFEKFIGKKSDKREAMKSICMYIFFGEDDILELKDYNEDLYNEIKKLKKNGYKNISMKSQRMESEYFREVVLKLDSLNYKFGHVYDSILSKEEDNEVIKEIMKEIFYNKFKEIIKIK